MDQTGGHRELIFFSLLLLSIKLQFSPVGKLLRSRNT